MLDNIAFLGLGIMGSCMAANLARGGVCTRGWNRTAGASGPTFAAANGVDVVPSAIEAVRNASVSIFCLGDESDLQQMLFDEPFRLADEMAEQAIVVDMSTSGADCARSVAEALGRRNIRFLDAPVSGGDVGARNGSLTIMVGGARHDFDECLPLFRLMGKNIVHCGSHGSGQAVKLCNQILCAVNMVAVCEAMHLAEKQGIDPQLIVDVCSTGAAGSWALATLGPRIAQSDYAPGFMIKHMLKDLRLISQTMAEFETDLPGSALARRNFDAARAGSESEQPCIEEGTQAMMRVYRQKQKT